MPKGISNPFPPLSVTEAASVADAIRANNAGHPMNRLLLADAMDFGPSTQKFRDLLTASRQYGFTAGSYKASTIRLTSLGEQLTKPRSEGERLDALRQGMCSIPLFEQMLSHYNNNSLPSTEFLRNTLERDPFSIRPELAGTAAELFTENGQEVGFVRTINGTPHVILEAGPPTASVHPNGDVEKVDETRDTLLPQVEPQEHPAPTLDTTGLPGQTDVPGLTETDHRVPADPIGQAVGNTPPENRQFFIAHG